MEYEYEHGHVAEDLGDAADAVDIECPSVVVPPPDSRRAVFEVTALPTLDASQIAGAVAAVTTLAPELVTEDGVDRLLRMYQGLSELSEPEPSHSGAHLLYMIATDALCIKLSRVWELGTPASAKAHELLSLIANVTWPLPMNVCREVATAMITNPRNDSRQVLDRLAFLREVVLGYQQSQKEEVSETPVAAFPFCGEWYNPLEENGPTTNDKDDDEEATRRRKRMREHAMKMDMAVIAAVVKVLQKRPVPGVARMALQLLCDVAVLRVYWPPVGARAAARVSCVSHALDVFPAWHYRVIYDALACEYRQCLRAHAGVDTLALANACFLAGFALACRVEVASTEDFDALRVLTSSGLVIPDTTSLEPGDDLWTKWSLWSFRDTPDVLYALAVEGVARASGTYTHHMIERGTWLADTVLRVVGGKGKLAACIHASALAKVLPFTFHDKGSVWTTDTFDRLLVDCTPVGGDVPYCYRGRVRVLGLVANWALLTSGAPLGTEGTDRLERVLACAVDMLVSIHESRPSSEYTPTSVLPMDVPEPEGVYGYTGLPSFNLLYHIANLVRALRSRGCATLSVGVAAIGAMHAHLSLAATRGKPRHADSAGLGIAGEINGIRSLDVPIEELKQIVESAAKRSSGLLETLWHGPGTDALRSAARSATNQTVSRIDIVEGSVLAEMDAKVGVGRIAAFRNVEGAPVEFSLRLGDTRESERRAERAKVASVPVKPMLVPSTSRAADGAKRKHKKRGADVE